MKKIICMSLLALMLASFMAMGGCGKSDSTAASGTTFFPTINM